MTDVSTLRRFNRSYTARIGALEESFLGSGRSLALNRLLFEIGSVGAGVLDLRERLGLDSGYLSRLLSRLTSDGLVVVTPDPDDRRRRVATLTEAGRDELAELDRRSDVVAHRLLDPLTDRQRRRLVEALATADLLVRAATIELHEVDQDDPLARTAVGHYVAELNRRFPGGFDPGDARLGAGVFVVATSDGVPVACGALQQLDPQTAEIKRMWVDRQWRGAGLGSRMLRHLEELARVRGNRRVVLDTNGTLTEAIQLYDRAGYAAVPRYNTNPYAEHWFAKPL